MLYIKTTAMASQYKDVKATRFHENDIPGLNLRGTVQNYLDSNWTTYPLSDETREDIYAKYREDAFDALIPNIHVIDVARRAALGENIIIFVKENKPLQFSRRRVLAELFHELGVRDVEVDKGVDVATLSSLSAVYPVKENAAPCRDERAPEPFDAEAEARHVVAYTRRWFEKNGPTANAVIGISGGKDSTVVAAILAKALGPDRVHGLLMPNEIQPDIADSRLVVELLGIRGRIVNVATGVDATHECLLNAVDAVTGEPAPVVPSSDAQINTPPRERMKTLYALAASLPGGGRVMNTCNASEDYIGYSTKYGDAAGDFAPLARYTATEVVAIGLALGLPEDLVRKTPSDGLCGKSDEDRFGFTYAVLDKFIRTGVCDDPDVKTKILRMHALNLHKLKPIPSCPRLRAA